MDAFSIKNIKLGINWSVFGAIDNQSGCNSSIGRLIGAIWSDSQVLGC